MLPLCYAAALLTSNLVMNDLLSGSLSDSGSSGDDVITRADVVIVNANWKRQIKLKAATCHKVTEAADDAAASAAAADGSRISFDTELSSG